mmetsp:Transcript_12868/g.47626  ORF Transcript_12868/g.47626 Transcript_12868/m.47626 type:complete len:320 (-) Transcript_12868:132-1091(-)
MLRHVGGESVASDHAGSGAVVRSDHAGGGSVNTWSGARHIGRDTVRHGRQVAAHVGAGDAEARVEALHLRVDDLVAVLDRGCVTLDELHVGANLRSESGVARVELRHHRRGESPALRLVVLPLLRRGLYAADALVGQVCVPEDALDERNRHLLHDLANDQGRAVAVASVEGELSLLVQAEQLRVHRRAPGRGVAIVVAGAGEEVGTSLLGEGVHLHAASRPVLEGAGVEGPAFVPGVNGRVFVVHGGAGLAVEDRILQLVDHVHPGVLVGGALAGDLVANKVRRVDVRAGAIERGSHELVGVVVRSPVRAVQFVQVLAG